MYVHVVYDSDIFHLLSFKEFIQWVRNTWRKDKQHVPSKTKQYRLGDVLWWLNSEDVLKEIGRIKEMDEVDTNTPGWFELRTAATKNILSKMSDTQKEDLRKSGEEMAEKGLPDHVKRK
jgi:hypothetical protein